MATFYASYPLGEAGGGGVPIYATFADFPAASSVPAGSLAVAADTGILYESNGSAWSAIGSPGAALSVGAFSATPTAEGLNITSNVLAMTAADGTHPGGVSIAAQTFAGIKTFSSATNMGSNVINAVADPSTAQQAATKNYVDLALAALNPAEACYAASTANITGTYLNGVAGVGATFIVTATGAFSIDGVSPSANARILIKDQSSGFQNGIYSLTVAGSLGVSPVLTRAANYNTASEMNSAGLIPIIAGTANALSSWQQIATITTVGTDALVFLEYTANPSLYLLKANNLSDLASTSTAFGNISPLTTKGDILTFSTVNARLGVGSNNQVITADSAQATGLKWATPTTGTVTTVSVASANGFAGSVANATTTPAITVSTSVTGILHGNGTAVAAAVAGDFPTLNQNTTGTAAGLSATLAVASGGTGATSLAANNVILGNGTSAVQLVAPSTSGNILTSNGTTWSSAAPGLVNLASGGDTAYNILTTDYVVLGNITSARTYTLPTAASVAGKTYEIIYVPTSGIPVLTLATTSSQTIRGVTTFKLTTPYESIVVVSDGSNWQVIDHQYVSAWVTYTPIYTGFGTPSNSSIQSKRVGDSLLLKGRFTAGTTTATEARLSLGYNGTDGGLTSADTGKIPTIQLAGAGYYDINASSIGLTLIEPSVTYITFAFQNNGGTALTKQVGNNFLITGGTFTFHALVPIAGWEG